MSSDVKTQEAGTVRTVPASCVLRKSLEVVVERQQHSRAADASARSVLVGVELTYPVGVEKIAEVLDAETKLHSGQRIFYGKSELFVEGEIDNRSETLLERMFSHWLIVVFRR